VLAQWVPLHAVSCSNLIETGGCAESREIPLRVTQTLRRVALDFARRVSPTQIPTIRIPHAGVVHEPSDGRSTLRLRFTFPRANLSAYARSTTLRSFLHISNNTRSRERSNAPSRSLWITFLGTPTYFRANSRPA